SVLSENCDPRVIGTFGFSSGRDTDKFDTVTYQWVNGLPVVSDSCGHFICKVVDKLSTATHTVFLGEVIDCDILKSEPPMSYAYYHKVIKGRAPKNAPTYIPDELIVSEPEADGAYICSVCSYEYDGDIPFADLPDDYVCPICGQPKSVFKKRG
ncbi:MAG: flavin reductase, partial [Oscillospiraceae bacterium]